jgi:hypothetical protein
VVLFGGALSRVYARAILVEFYVVAHSWEWLVGENHHDVLFAVGDHAIAAVIVGTG